MNRISQLMTTAGVAALSLAVVAGPAAAANVKPTKLTRTHLSLKATQTQVSKSDKFKATVAAKLRAKKAPLAAESVELFQRAKGDVKWIDTGVAMTTDSTGVATFTFVQSATKEQYRVEFAGDTTYDASHSGTITIKKVKATK